MAKICKPMWKMAFVTNTVKKVWRTPIAPALWDIPMAVTLQPPPLLSHQISINVAITGAGLSDLVKMLKWERKEEGRSSAAYEYPLEANWRSEGGQETL